MIDYTEIPIDDFKKAVEIAGNVPQHSDADDCDPETWLADATIVCIVVSQQLDGDALTTDEAIEATLPYVPSEVRQWFHDATVEDRQHLKDRILELLP